MRHPDPHQGPLQDCRWYLRRRRDEGGARGIERGTGGARGAQRWAAADQRASVCRQQSGSLRQLGDDESQAGRAAREPSGQVIRADRKGRGCYLEVRELIWQDQI